MPKSTIANGVKQLKKHTVADKLMNNGVYYVYVALIQFNNIFYVASNHNSCLMVVKTPQ